MESYAVSKKRQSVLYILMLLIFVGFFAAEIAYPSERSESMKLQNITYQGKFIWHKSDGTQEVIKVPGVYDVAVNETMVLTTRLPENYNENTLAIRSSLQDVSFYIDGKLRTKYDTTDTRPFGKNSASRYIFLSNFGKRCRKRSSAGTDHTYFKLCGCGKHNLLW